MTLLPQDWNDEPTVPLHGVSRNVRLGGYMVVLLLNKRQVHFGPFRETRTHAAQMHDRLLRYFLPFAKSRALPNCPAEVFSEFSRFETEELIGEGKLQKHYAKLKTEAEGLGYDLLKEESVRMNSILEGGGLHSKSSKLVQARDNARRRALIRLEVVSLKNASTFDLTGLVRQLSIPHDKWKGGSLPERHEEVQHAFCRAQNALVCYVRELKLALEIDPNLSTK